MPNTTRSPSSSANSAAGRAAEVRALPTTVKIVRHSTPPADELLEAIRAAHPGASPTADGRLTWTEGSAVRADDTTAYEASVERRPDGSRLTLTATYEGHVPYFWWVFDRQIARSARRLLEHRADAFEATALGRAAPSEPKRPWWAPPESMTTDQIRTIATLSLLMALAEYASSLLTQTLDFVAKTYSASDAQLGVVTAVTRVGNLIVLIGGALADRVGRRRLLLTAVAFVLVCSALSAAAPSLRTWGLLQVLVNGGTNLAFLVGFIAAVEEAPEASRTYTIAIVGIASGLGFVLGALLLPLADLHAQAWRALYAVAALGLLFLPSVSRNLHETKRFEALVARHARRGRVGEVVDRRYGGRFAIMCAAGFLLYMFFAPQTQFTNRYLGDERGFSGLGILVLRTVTQAVPALIAAYAGGRLAESRGRRPVARQGLLLGAAAMVAFFVGGGVVLWLGLALATVGLSVAGPSLSSFSSELFPTEVRGTAGAGQVIASVLGSATGLLLAGYLAQPLGSIGAAIAVTAVGPVIVALFLIRYLPEARGLLLDEVSPSEV
jgi:MFS family permease